MYTKDIIDRFVVGIPDCYERDRAQTAADKLTYVDFGSLQCVMTGEVRLRFAEAGIDISLLETQFDLFLFHPDTMKDWEKLLPEKDDDPTPSPEENTES